MIFKLYGFLCLHQRVHMIWCLKIITFNLFRCIKSLGKLGVDILDCAQLLSPSIPKSSKKSWSNRSDPSVGFFSNGVTKSVYIIYEVIDLCKNYAQSNLFTMTTFGIKKSCLVQREAMPYLCSKNKFVVILVVK